LLPGRDERQGTEPSSTSARCLRHWEFWLALSLATFLRLWHMEVTQFMWDQANMMRLARLAVTHGLVPLTSIGQSIGTAAPPMSVYFLMPFAAFGADPMPAALFTAAWNLAAVALCYAFALRYFGRRAAAIATLLFATCGVPVDLSRFIWAQNYMPPLIVLWAMTLFAGALRGTRGWLAANLALLVAIASLHPIALLLSPLVVVAHLLSPRRLRLREYALAPALAALLLVPTLAWEIVSRGADFAVFARIAGARASVSLDSIRLVFEALGTPAYPRAEHSVTFAVPIPASPYSALGPLNPAISLLAAFVYAASYLVLTALVVAPARRWWRSVSTAERRNRRPLATLRLVWRGLRADPTWRTYLLLWLWIGLPPLVTVRHSTTLYVQYMMVLFPAPFVATGLAVDRLLRAASGDPGRRWLAAVRNPVRTERAETIGRGVLVCLVAALIVGQALQSALFIASQANGHIDNEFYGYSAGELQAADRALTTLQRQQGASAVYVSEPEKYFRQTLDYLLVGDHTDRIGVRDTCLALPSPDSGPGLVVAPDPRSPAAGVLQRLPQAARVASIPMLGIAPLTVYRVPGGAAPPAGETTLPSTDFRSPGGDGLRLEAGQLETPSLLRLRWSVRASTPPRQPALRYRVVVRTSSAGNRAGTVIGQTDCQPTHWVANQALFSWLALPSSWQTRSMALSIDVYSYTSGYWTPSIGPIHTLTFWEVSSPLAQLQASPAPGSGVGPAGTISGGTLTLPASALTTG
jgi:4-amino-4-deoxy-L-arabinose transferase-like glycosyltransferase